MTIAIDYFDEGVRLYKEGKGKPFYDGTAPTSYIIAGWEHAAKEAKDPWYKCDCVSFDCPSH